MAPALHYPEERDLAGFWGEPTSTIDWCEANYEVTFYIAEFWNTVSNILLILLPLGGAVIAIQDRLEGRFVWCNISLMVVGFGSSAFHGTLLYNMQLLDEIPMIWGSAFLLYSQNEINGAPKSHNRPLQAGLFIYCSIVTIVYITIKEPVFHQTAYGLMVCGMIISGIRIIRHYEHSVKLFWIGLITYAVGFAIWNMDNIFCPEIRKFRSSLPPRVRPFFQGHAWWHLMAGTGTYLGLLFCINSRLINLKRKPRIKFEFGVVPTVRPDEPL